MSVAIAPPAQADSTRISTRMLVLFSTLFLLLLAIIAATVVALVASTEAAQWQGRQTEAARSATFRVLSFIEDAQRGLSVGAQFSDPAAYPDIPAQLLSDNPAFDEVVVVDVRGRVLSNEFRDLPLLAGTAAGRQAEWLVRWLTVAETETPETPTDTTFPTQPIPAEVTAPYVSPVQRTADGQPYLIMSLPTEGFEGVMAVRLSLEVFSQLIAELTFGETGSAYVASETGVVLAHTDPAVVAANTTIADRPEFIRAPMFDLLTEPYDNFRGQPVVGSVERIPGLNWVVFTEISQQEALSATRTAILVLIIVTLIVFVIILTAGSSLMRWLVFRPLASLRASLEQVAQGNFDVQVQVNRSDEVGEVTKAFNDMIRIVNERAIERERLIRELQAAKRMADENSRLKSEFLSTMSHELRTPMNAIEGFVGIILNRMGGTDYNDKTGTYLTRVRANSQRLLSLINDFLDLSRVESGRLDLAALPFEPRQLAERWRAELSVLAESKNIGFDFQIDPKLPKALVGDEEAISKVAINLISNAIKFTEKGAVTVEMQAAGDQWNIVVTDTGIGIPAHAREYVFEEFRQVDQTSKRKYGGTGLGLAIVQKYTRSMGGTVTLRSEVGLGSVFTISLPMVTVTQMKKLQEV